MNRILGLTVALVFVPLGLTTTTHAQLTPYDADWATSPCYGVSAYGNQSYGGFGLQYAQPVPNGGVVMDQYGLLHVQFRMLRRPVRCRRSVPVTAAQPQARTTRSLGPRRGVAPAALSAPDRFFGLDRRKWWYPVFTGHAVSELRQRLRRRTLRRYRPRHDVEVVMPLGY